MMIVSACKILNVLNDSHARKYNDVAVSQALSSATAQTYHEYKVELERLASKVKDEEEGGIYALLSDLCSMSLAIRGRTVQYVPLFEFAEEVSFGIGCVKGTVCDLLAAIAPRVSNDMLRARIADVVAMRRKGGNNELFVEIALRAYFSLPLYGEKAPRNCALKIWRRAISLAKGPTGADLGKRLLSRFKQNALEMIGHKTGNDAGCIVDICRLLIECELYGQEDVPSISNCLKEAYDAFLGEAAYLQRDECADLLLTMYNKSGEQDKINEALVMKGDSWMKDGYQWLEKEKNDKVMAAHRFEEAERAYLQLSKNDRQLLGVEAKLRECVRLKHEGFALWSERMERVKICKIDIKDDVAKTREHMVEVAAPRDKFARFLRIYRFAVGHLRGFTSSSALDKIFADSSCRQLSEDGRTEYSGILNNEEHSESQASVLWMRYIVATRIAPAYDELKKIEMSQHDFSDIAESIATCLLKRQYSIGFAWWLGYLGKWRVAATVLIPQIEYLVSLLLRNHGCNVIYTQPGKLTETFMALSSLLSLAGAKEALGVDLHKEFELLFGGAPYMNLRNKVMHGLIDDSRPECYYPFDMYVWWFSMRLMLVEPAFREIKVSDPSV